MREIFTMVQPPITLLLFLICTPSAVAQAVAPKTDFFVLQAPQPIATLPNAAPTNLLALTSQILKTNGFEIVRLDQRDCTLEAHKALRSQYEGYDNVLVWLDRAIDDPTTVRVHVLFGRYIRTFGTARLGHVLLTKEEEDAITNAWKTKLIETLAKIGG
jgi:hypothetical protein